eukprot:11191476-Lingulodinium_polyedra.AAC.1
MAPGCKVGHRALAVVQVKATVGLANVSMQNTDSWLQERRYTQARRGWASEQGAIPGASGLSGAGTATPYLGIYTSSS